MHHPIEGLMAETMNQLKHLIDVETIIGDPIQTADGSTVIPISKVSFGFAAGGSEFPNQKKSDQESGSEEENLPFGGGSGGGVSITPIAFLVTHKQGNNIIHLNENNKMLDKLVEITPQAVEKIKEIILEIKAKNHD